MMCWNFSGITSDCGIVGGTESIMGMAQSIMGYANGIVGTRAKIRNSEQTE